VLELQGRTIEVVNVAENDKEDLIADLVAIVYSFTARLYGQRRSKRSLMPQSNCGPPINIVAVASPSCAVSGCAKARDRR
jgi:hypothetical protein